MPNRSEHQVIGVSTGMATAMYQLQLDRQAGIVTTPVLGSGDDWAQTFLYLLAGAIGGCIGGVIPDVLEPADNPHHRQLFHSVTFSATAMVGYESAIINSTNPAFRVLTRGVQAGHLSHVVADSLTRRGIPFIL